MRRTKLLLSIALAFAITTVARGQAAPSFTKITNAGSIVTEPGAYLACAWGDYDNDGFPDLFVTASNDTSVARKNFLFHNNRDGTFSNVTNTVVTAEARTWTGCGWADYDNDGNLDLYVLSSSSQGLASESELFRNNGDGTFTKMSARSAGAIVTAADSYGPAWADYDRDGFLDVLVARIGTDFLFHNNGDGTFSNVVTNIGIALKNQAGYRAMWGDYDNDLWPDLSLEVNSATATPGKSLVYHNLGGGTFTNQVPGIDTQYGTWADGVWVDHANHGYLDFFALSGPVNLLYQNNRDGTFTKTTNNTVGNPDVCAWGDYDNDGFLDLYVIAPTGPHLYHNNGDGTLTEILSGAIVEDQIKVEAVACTWVDYDNDGFLDLFVPYNGGGGNMINTNRLYHNNGNNNGWLKVKLVGTASNRSAIGAKVRVQAIVRGQPVAQMREINSGDGFSGNPLEAHFGLGDATNVDWVRIEWPSGIVQTLTNVAPRQFLTVVEHQKAPVPSQPAVTSVTSSNGVVNLTGTGIPGLIYLLEGSTNLVDWVKLSVRSNATGTVSFSDPKAKNLLQRFYRLAIP